MIVDKTHEIRANIQLKANPFSTRSNIKNNIETFENTTMQEELNYKTNTKNVERQWKIEIGQNSNANWNGLRTKMHDLIQNNKSRWRLSCGNSIQDGRPVCPPGAGTNKLSNTLAN